MNPKIPRPDEPVVDGRGLITRPWRNYLIGLAAVGDLSSIQAAIAELRSEIAQGGGLPSDARVYGDFSVETFGLLTDGLVRITLVNDQPAPAPRSYYGTDDDGARGYHALPSTGDVDGGYADTIYTAAQFIDGGGA